MFLNIKESHSKTTFERSNYIVYETNSMEKKIIIIGAGIAGLSAGYYARMNGYDAEIYESHSLPGGLCTSWKKGEYTIDGCLHWLTGSDGRTFILYTNADQLEKHMKELSPADTESIELLCRLIRKFTKFKSHKIKPSNYSISWILSG